MNTHKLGGAEMLAKQNRLRREESSMRKTEEVKLFGRTAVDRVEHYGWRIVDKPGRFVEVDKHDVYVDIRYQRSANDQKTASIARNWSWVAFGAISLALRDDKLWVIDGQHRVMAARLRSDIHLLPAIVFKLSTERSEATAFLQANTNRKAMIMVEKFNAYLFEGNDVALRVKALLDEYGLVVSAHSPSAKTVKCVALLMQWEQKDSEILHRVWPLIVKVSDGKRIVDKLVAGMCYFEKYASESLMVARNTEKVLAVGLSDILDAMKKACNFYGDGGPKYLARGLLEVINRARRFKITLEDVPQKVVLVEK